jgi:hypothetical protein
MYGDDTAKSRQIEGRYANTFKVGHNAFEFVFDFGQFDLEGVQEHFWLRVITGPVYAKAFSELLLDAIQQYEQTYGPIHGDHAGDIEDVR